MKAGRPCIRQHGLWRVNAFRPFLQNRIPERNGRYSYGIKKPTPAWCRNRRAACSLQTGERGVLEFDDGAQAVPRDARGQRDPVLSVFLFQPGVFPVAIAVHADGRFCELLSQVLEKERFGVFQRLFSVSGIAFFPADDGGGGFFRRGVAAFQRCAHNFLSGNQFQMEWSGKGPETPPSRASIS